MGFGGYLAARNDAEHYAIERQRESSEIQQMPQAERLEVQAILIGYGLTEAQAKPIVDALAAQPDKWVDFMMRFELGLDAPQSGRARTSAVTIAVSYMVGGFIPLLPYILIAAIPTAQIVSVIATLLALLVFGYVKGRFTGSHPVQSALQTALVGGLAAATAFIVAKLVA